MEKNYLGKVKTTEFLDLGGVMMSEGALIFVTEEVGKNYNGDVQGIDFSLPVIVPKNKCTNLESI